MHTVPVFFWNKLRKGNQNWKKAKKMDKKENCMVLNGILLMPISSTILTAKTTAVKVDHTAGILTGASGMTSVAADMLLLLVTRE